MRLHRPATYFGVLSLAALVFGFARLAISQTDPALAPYTVGEEKSGFLYATPQTRTMQTDDFNNPGFLWIDKGKTLWNQVAGTEGKSCASCHNAAEVSMKGVGATYPNVDKSGKLVDIEERINLERARMGAPAFAWESDELLAMTAYVKLQSRGTPVKSRYDRCRASILVSGQKILRDTARSARYVVPTVSRTE